MCKKFLLGLTLCLFLAQLANATDIIVVGQNDDNDGVFVSFLEDNGHTVVYRNDMATLDDDKIAALEATDLIFVTSNNNSGNYDDGDELEQWSSITTPLVLFEVNIARNSRWQFMDTADRPTANGTLLEAVEPIHPIFTGVKLDANKQVDVIDESNGDGVRTLAGLDVGSGTLIAKVPGDDNVLIAEWEAGVPYYDGSLLPLGPRMLFLIIEDDGRFNMNEMGQLLILNIIKHITGEGFGNANSPNPEDEEIEVSIDTDLSWNSGTYAYRHNVYFSTVFDDTNDADLTNPLGVLLVEDHDVNNYDLDRIDYGQTYYWRVDEVNSAPDRTIFKGNTWSFTTEYFSYPIVGDKIIATASSSAAGQGPENTINRSGLEPSSELPLLSTGLHSYVGDDMWLTEADDPAPSIQYEFDTVYNLHEMLVWNYNGESINTFYGASDVLVESSLDGESWTATDTTTFDQAPGTNGYEYGNIVSFGVVPAKYVRITINSNYDPTDMGFFNQYGLSEVMFMAVPIQAKDPVPADGAVDMALDGVNLGWTAGRGAVEHDVYFGADIDSMALLEAGLSQTEYAVSQALDLSSTYYWRVDEVNNAEAYPVWAGGAWSFTTIDYLVVDDFEDYNNTADYRIYDNAWVDGYDNPANGALIGHDPDFVANPNADIVETGITYNDTDQSAPIYFDNTAAFSSEVSIDPALLAIGSDWSKGSPTALVIYVYGDAANLASERLYASVNNSKTYYDGDLTVEDWSAFVVDLTGVNLGGVTKLAIGVERGGAAGGAGIIYVDEIRLYGSAPVAE